MNRLLIFSSVFAILWACNPKQIGNRSYNGPDYGSPNVKQSLKNDFAFVVTEFSADSTYGYSPENPIMVGGGSEGPKNERRFLNALAGPDGQPIRYQRLGSCCSFASKNSDFGYGLLDRYKVEYENQETEIILYINMYDSDTLKVPVGLSLK